MQDVCDVRLCLISFFLNAMQIKILEIQSSESPWFLSCSLIYIEKFWNINLKDVWFAVAQKVNHKDLFAYIRGNKTLHL